MMKKIDGSHGEGGGQVLRTAIALSAVTMRPLVVENIRANRPNPGLKKQHIAGIELIGRLVDANIEGLKIGSKEIRFVPNKRKSGLFEYDIGTAGSIGLVLQAVIPVAIFTPGDTKLNLRGGTDVAWSPPIDYMREVFAHNLALLNVFVEINQIKRGHYPRGGGHVQCIIKPVESIPSFEYIKQRPIRRLGGISHCVRLPSHVASRQAKAAMGLLSNYGYDNVMVSEEHYPRNQDPHLGAGSGVILWAEFEDGIRLGADSLGAKGKRAEEVGEEAARKLNESLSSNYPIEAHFADMLIPYMALSEGDCKIGVTKISSHLITNVWVAEELLGCEASLKGEIGGPGVLSISGVGSFLGK